jgi:site-specific DNA-methyltransferase (adenine-specific)
MIEVDRIYTHECVEFMGGIEDNFIDLTITSPPYDNLRKYNGYSFDFESIG